MYAGPSEACSTTDDGDGIDTGATDLEPKDAAIRDYPDAVTHPAFKVVDGLRCSSISLPDSPAVGLSMLDRMRSRIRLQLSKMATAELVTGAVSGGPALADGTSLGAATSADGAAVKVESWLASALHNGVGVVVIPVWVDRSSMMTVTGHKVIADAGFTGDMSNPTDGTPGVFSFFGMGAVGVASTSAVFLGVASGASNVDISTNVVERISEAYVQLVFDPCAVGFVTLT